MTPLQIAIGGLALMVGLLALAQRLGGWQNKPLARCLGITAAGCFVAWCFLLFPAWCGWASAVIVGSICLRFIITWTRKPAASTEQSPADSEHLPSLWSQALAFWSPLNVVEKGYLVGAACFVVWCVWALVWLLSVEKKIVPPWEPTPSFGVSMILPDGRAIIASNPHDLQTARRNNTMDGFNRLLGGKWIRLSGKIEDNLGNGKAV